MRRWAVVVIGALVWTGCTPLIARFVARRVSNHQLAVESFHGTLTEKYVLVGQPDGALVKDVWYQKLGKTRVEVKAPEALAGQLFVYDGAQVLIWWPSTRFGMRLRGMPPPSEEELRTQVRNTTYRNLKQYAFTQLAEATIAGQPTDRWHAEPRGAVPYRYAYDSWADQETSTLLRLEVFEGPGRPWYEMNYDGVEYGLPVAADAFAFNFPADATVLEWDFAGAGVSIEAARAEVGFELLTPHSEYDVQKVLTDKRVVPTATLVMNDGPTWLSLTEVVQTVPMVPATGKKVSVNGVDGYLEFAGAYTTLSWVKKGINLTLVSNLPHPELVALASTVD